MRSRDRAVNRVGDVEGGGREGEKGTIVGVPLFLEVATDPAPAVPEADRPCSFSR